MVRALNAVKLERLFSKPFLYSMEGHRDGVYCMSKHHRMLSSLVTGAADGELKLWDLSKQRAVWSRPKAHERFIRGVSFLQNGAENIYGNRFLSCSDDGTIKLWDTQKEDPLVSTYLGSMFSGVDHHINDGVFVSSGEGIHVWRHDRQEPIQSYQWGHDSFTTVKFNPTETNLIGATCQDRSIVLLDQRLKSALHKTVLQMRSNALCWNPREAFNFTVANEDHCCYTFDMRKLSSALNVFRDHVNAVLDLDYSPTGEEIVTGSYDKTIRIWNTRSGHSRDVYHTKRMQKVTSVRYSMDASYVISASDDCNLRVWRAEASSRMSAKSKSEQASLQYSEAIKQKYQHLPEISKIKNHRHLPNLVRSSLREKRIVKAAENKKTENRRKHTKPGAVPYQSERRDIIVRQET